MLLDTVQLNSVSAEVWLDVISTKSSRLEKCPVCGLHALVPALGARAAWFRTVSLLMQFARVGSVALEAH